ncbi:MAG: ABC transporter ATP-binding protein [Polyangiaceae bacterium]|nr:ABC transporter ATP-binding protein [Polyangiaceae bacterium]NUQ76763.1 ABC transporter ATP-binding protein [Polyangiaceae bacterium]
MIEVEHVTKAYGSFVAVDDVSFTVEKGEIVGFLGPNGAGKSTTLRILAGFLGATAGRVRIAGHDIADQPIEARRSLGYMPETSPLYPEMRVAEYLAFRAELKRIPRAKRSEAVARSLSEARVDDVASIVIGHLSKGYRQRVGLADALLGSPPLLILDEPTAGLDPNQIREVRALIRRIGEDHTVLLSTHILPEVEATCSRALVIARGRLVAQGSIDEIRAMRRPSGVRVRARGDVDRAALVLKEIPGVRRVDIKNRDAFATELSVSLKKGKDAGAMAEAIVSALVGAGLGVREVAAEAPSLEQVFSELTEGPPAPAEDAAASRAEEAS